MAFLADCDITGGNYIERFPEEGFDRYIEVFGGAGWVLFGKEVGKELEVFNDAEISVPI